MSRALATFFIAIVVPILQTGGRAPAPEPPAYEVREAYEIYSQLIPNDSLVKAAHDQVVQIQAETRPYEMCLIPGDEEEKSLFGPAIQDYLEENKKKWLLQRLFDIEQPYDLIRSANAGAGNGAASAGLGPNVRLSAARGWIEFSAVGFNPDKTIAVVYMGHYCGNLCGGGGFTVLERKDDKWVERKFKGMSCSWAS